MVRGSAHACHEGTAPRTASRQVRIEDSSDSDSAFESEDDEKRVIWADKECRQRIILGGGGFGKM